MFSPNMLELNLRKKKAETVPHVFIEIVNKSNCKPNKLRVDQGREFNNSLMQNWLNDNDILMYSTHNESKSAVLERFIQTSKGKIYKKLISNDSKSYLGYLNISVDEYNNTFHSSIDKKNLMMLIILL